MRLTLANLFKIACMLSRPGSTSIFTGSTSLGWGGAEEMVVSGINSLQIPRNDYICLPSDLFINTMFTVCCAPLKP